ncbi:MAG: hypothetical protein AAB649_01515, partial [Patescibacteria group bacterium]
MDNTSANISPDDVVSEFNNITQEIYKKNAALDQTNKTRSLLQKIDEIVLSSVADPKAIAQKVVDLTARETGYKEVQILVKNKEGNTLERIAVSQTDAIKQIEQFFKLKFVAMPVSLNDSDNIIVRAFIEKRAQVSHDMYDVLGPTIAKDQAKQIQEMLSILTITVYPLISRGSAIGALVLSLDQSENNLNNYQHDLRERLPGVIGVAMDNALLYQEIQLANEKLKALD